jgi:integrase
MPTKKLTAVVVPSLAPGEYWDTILPGLILRVGARRRTWQYRVRSGETYRRITLGHFPAMELAEAREAARKLIERLEKGAPPSPPVPHPHSAAAFTLGALIDRYERMRQKESARTKTLPAAMATLRRNLKPWLDLPAAAFTKADLRAARDSVSERGALMQANRLLAYFGPVARWAAEEDLIPVNFTPAIRRSPEQKRSRKLSHKEIAAIWRACDRLNGNPAAHSFARLVKFLLVTGQRRDEGASLRYHDITDGVWLQQDNKASRPHKLGLPKLALALVGNRAPDDLVFAGRTPGKKLSGFSKLKNTLDELSGVSDWRLHDLRRTAASGMQEAHVPNHIVQAVLNHSLPGMSAVYLHAQLEKEKAEALQAWATALTHIVRGLRVVAS